MRLQFRNLLRGIAITNSHLNRTNETIVDNFFAYVGAQPERDCSFFPPSHGGFQDSFFDSHFGWLIGDDGLFATSDGGRQWTLLDKGYRPTLTNAGNRQFTMTISDFALLTPRVGWILYRRGGILKTVDGGKSWINQTPTTATGRSIFRKTQFLNEMEGWVIGGEVPVKQSDSSEAPVNGWILSTVNGSLSWRKVPRHKLLHDFKFVNNRIGWLIEGGEILHTNNAGRTWAPAKGVSSSYPSRLFFIDATTGFILDPEKGIHRTENGGQSWSHYVLDKTLYPQRMQFADAKTGWIMASQKWVENPKSSPERFPLITKDGGKTWQILYNEKRARRTLEFFFLNDREGWLVSQELNIGHDDSELEVFHTTDGGQRWAKT